MSGDILERALSYPFPRPATSIAIAGDRVLELVQLDTRDLGSSVVQDGGAERTLAEVCRDGALPGASLEQPRTAVLAYGSNASPAGLGWKFPDERSAVVPLIRGKLRGVDVVYSSHIAVYGSVPATLQKTEMGQGPPLATPRPDLRIGPHARCCVLVAMYVDRLILL